MHKTGGILANTSRLTRTNRANRIKKEFYGSWPLLSMQIS